MQVKPLPVDYGQEIFRLECVEDHSEAMSAIVRIFTSEGFLVAADGLGTPIAEEAVPRDAVQKILSLHHGAVIASICEISELRLDDDSTLELVTVLQSAANNVESKVFRDLREYAELLALELQARVSDWRSDTIPNEWNNQTRVNLDGLLPRMMPEQETIRIVYGHSGTVVMVDHDPFRVQRCYGSKIILDLLFENSVTVPDWIVPYRRVCQETSIRSLTGAQQTAIAIIQAQSDPRALELDSAICRAIGGRIHIATLTAAKGFQWISGFEPSPTTPQSVANNSILRGKSPARQRWNRLFLVAVICWAFFCMFVQPILMAREGVAHWEKERDECRSGIYSKDPSGCLKIADIEYHMGLYAGFGERYDEAQGDWSYPWYFGKLWPLLLLETVALPALLYALAWGTARTSIWIWRGSKKKRFTQY